MSGEPVVRACVTPSSASSNSGSAEHVRDLPGSFDRGVVHAIGGHLAAVAGEHGVAIPWAVESGSRAWGFPDDLVSAEAVTRELGSGVLSVAVRTWVDDQFRAAQVFEDADVVGESRERAADGFRRMLRRWAPGADQIEEGRR